MLIFLKNFRKFLLIGATSPSNLWGAKRVALEIRKLKAAFGTTMKDKRRSDLKLIQMHMTGSINVEEVVPKSIRKTPGRLLSSSLVFKTLEDFEKSE